MARVAIVSYDVQTIFGKAGGVGAFTTRWANLLRQAGERRHDRDDSHRLGTDASRSELAGSLQGKWDFSDRIAGSSGTFDAMAGGPDDATGRDRRARTPGLRHRLFSGLGQCGVPFVARAAVFVQSWSGLRDGIAWTLGVGTEFQRKYPELPKDLHLAYQERYSARHSDFVVSPSHYMVEHLKALSWEFPGEVKVLGLPMPEPADAAGKFTRLPRFGRSSISAVWKRARAFGILSRALQHFAREARYKPEIVLLGAPPMGRTYWISSCCGRPPGGRLQGVA